MTGRRPLPAALILVGILAGALAFRWWGFAGQSFSFGSDESRFIGVAKNLSNGYFPEGDTEWFGSRIGLLWPVAAVYRLAHASDATTAIWPIAGSLLAAVAAYLLGRDLASRRVGLVAAALVAAAPLEALVAARLRPDPIMPAFLGFAMWFALRAGRDRGRGAVLAGLCLGGAWSVRESAIVLVPVLAVAMWRAGPRALGAAAAGAATVPLLTAAIFAAGAGAPIQALLGAGTEGEWRDPVAAFSLDGSYAAAIVRDTVDWGTPFFLLAPVILGAALAVLYRRERRARLPGIWLAWTALYLEFGTLVNLGKPARYLTMCTIPAALLIALAVDGRFAALAPIGLALVAVGSLWAQPARQFKADDSDLVARVAARLRALPDGPMITESYTWWAKIRTYNARERLAIPRARDPEFFSAEEVAAARELDPLPAVADYRGGYVVTGPVHPRPGWPLNWGAVQGAIRQEIPAGELQLVAGVGAARIWKWPR